MIVPFRKADSSGFQKTKLDSRSADRVEHLVALRKSWAELQNREYARLVLKARVSHESLAAQGISRKPTSHIGTAALRKESEGIPSERGDRYLSIIMENQTGKSAKRILQQQLEERRHLRTAGNSRPEHELAGLARESELPVHEHTDHTHEYSRER